MKNDSYQINEPAKIELDIMEIVRQLGIDEQRFEKIKKNNFQEIVLDSQN